MVNSNRRLKYYLLISGLLTFYSSYGQKDRVFLNNGSIIKGSITQLANGQIKMTVGDSQVDLTIGDIHYVKVSKTNNLNDNQKKKLETLVRPYFKKGLSYILSTGLLIGEDETPDGNSGMFSSQGAVLYKFAQQVQLGVSIGYDKHYLFNVAPVSIYFKGDLTKRPGSIFALGAIGISKAWNNKNSQIQYDNVNGRKVVQFGVGNAWDLKKIQLIATIGWKRQNVEASNDPVLFDFAPRGNQFVVLRSIDRAEIKLGIVF